MKKTFSLIAFLLFFLLFIQQVKAQMMQFNYDEDGNIELNHSWKFHDGDNMEWAAPGFDDSGWDTLQTEMLVEKMPERKFTGIGWFRLHLKIDSAFVAGNPLALIIDQEGASEIFVDGHKIETLGKIGTNTENEIRYDPGRLPVLLNLTPGRTHLIAIRYSNHEMDASYSKNGIPRAGFTARLVPSNNYLGVITESRDKTFLIVMTLFGFFIALGIAHLLIYLFYPVYRSNLYYFIFLFFLSYFPLGIALQTNIHGMHENRLLQLLTIIDMPLFFTSFLAFLYSIFYEKFQKKLWIFISAAGISIAGIFIDVGIAALIITLLVIAASVEAIRVIIVANRKKKSGSRIIGLGGLFLALFVISMLLLIIIGGGLQLSDSSGQLFMWLLLFSIVCLPLCMSIHLAREFAQTNRSLSHKLKEVEVLSEKTIEQEKEKQKLLETEKERLEIQVNERTSEISEQKKIIEEKNKDITDSILYAKKIQDAMLPAADITKQLFPSSFILFRPKDIVSGDFYWIAELKNSEPETPNSKLSFIAAADCTGHGVPGALMSMTGNNFLNQLVNERNLISTKDILTHLDEAIRKSLKQERADVESRDGMDIALCRFSADFSELLYSGANRPLWILRDNEILEFKPDKKSIGGSHSSNIASYSEQKIPLQKNDCVYIFSDGFADQFGGPEGKKFMTKHLKKVLLTFGTMNMDEQKNKLEEAFLNWKKEITQVDDVLVIGIRI